MVALSPACVALGCLLLASPAFTAQPVQSITAIPSAVAANTPTTVTISAAITDRNLIPNSMTLLRISPTGGPAVLGVLHDDGVNGDQIAGDQLYTLRINLNDAPGAIGLQVSVALRGQLLRVLSATINITVTSASVALPPDPGDAGMVAIAGIDSDNDGVRDDVQRYIALAYPASVKTRAALTQVSKVMQSLLVDANVQQASISHMVDFSHALECSAYINGGTLPGNVSELVAHFVNTQARSNAYKTAQSQFGGQLYKFGSPAQQKAFCSFDTSSLPN